MNKDDIRIRQVIVHILDSTTGAPILSDEPLEYGSDFGEFLKGHISRIISGDQYKECEFYKEQSEIYQLLRHHDDESFVKESWEIAEFLYGIMNSNTDIPSADLVIIRFDAGEQRFIGILKMNFKESYSHRTMSVDGGRKNQIVLYKTNLPKGTQRLTEAAIINLDNFRVQLIEKRYEVNGEQSNYFSYLFLKCAGHLSHKTKLSLISKAVSSVHRDNLEEYKQYQADMRARNILLEKLDEDGEFVVEEIAERLFEENPEMKIAFQDKMEKYDLVKETVRPQCENTTKKYQKQELLTDTGVELRIPMEVYNDDRKVSFKINDDGTTDIHIMGIGHINVKM